MSRPSYSIDIESVRRVFPPGVEPAQLLLDFAAWLQGRPWGSVGCFDLVGQFSDRAPIFDGSPLRENFGLFLRLPEGSAVGAWYGAGLDARNPPIVVLGSEGQNEIVAKSLESLLAQIASRSFEDSDFAPHEDVEDATDDLADWLEERFSSNDLEGFMEPPSGLPDFGQWVGKWCRDREQFWTDHPVSKELGRHLTAHLPKGTNPWDKTIFEVAIIGKQFQGRVLRRGRQPVEQAAAIEPLLRGLREQMCQTQPALGLWYSMSFGLYAQGHVMPHWFDYETRPMIGESAADLSEANSDLIRAPRPERWVPAWLAN